MTDEKIRWSSWWLLILGRSFNMNKKIFIFLVILSIISVFVIGCNNKNNVTSTREYGFQPPIDKLYWGMPLDKIEKLLKIKSGVDGVVYNYEKPVTTIILKEKIEVFGYNATVSLKVYDKPNEEWYPYKSSYLGSIILTYEDIDGQKIKDNINEKYKNTGNDWVDTLKNKCTTWLSDDEIKDIKPSIKEELQNYWFIIDEHEHSNTKNYNSLHSIKKEEDESINNIVLVYSDKGAVVTFNGDTAYQINQIITNK